MVKFSFARLDAFARGQIVALAKEGYKAPAIRKRVLKKDCDDFRGSLHCQVGFRGFLASFCVISCFLVSSYQ